MRLLSLSYPDFLRSWHLYRRALRQFQEKHNLNFILLSDNANELKTAFKEHLTQSSDIHRSTFILDEEGTIIKAWEKVDVDEFGVIDGLF